MSRLSHPLLRLALLIGSATAGPALFAAAPANAWAIDASVSARLGYDTNVFGTDNERSTQALANRAAGTTALGARVVLRRGTFTLSYAPTATWYAGLSREDNVQHVLALATADRRGAWSWSLENALTRIAGSKEALRYNFANSFGHALARERRDQLQDAGKAWLRRDFDATFVRLAAQISTCNPHVENRAPTGPDAGWLNWVDRREYNGGLDLGWKSSRDTAWFTGVRLGEQHQGFTSWAPAHSSNHYTRVLLGGQTKVGERFTASVTAGPDFRRYSAAGLCLADRTPRVWYFDAALTATLDGSDSLTCTARQERALSSTGQSAADVSAWSLQWKRRLTAALTAQLGGQYQRSRYAAPYTRDDELTSFSAALQWSATKRLTVTAELLRQAGRDQFLTTATSGRDFNRTVTSLGARWVF